MNTNFSTGLYKFEDVPLDSLSAYYGTEYRFDKRGIRQFTFEKDFEMSAGISLPWTSARSMIQSSLRYRFISLDQEPQNRKIKELFWEASGDFQWIKALQLKGRMSSDWDKPMALFIQGRRNTKYRPCRKILGILVHHGAQALYDRINIICQSIIYIPISF